MSEDLFLVVMAGGSGTRFWPRSTSRKPKQFLSFGKDEGSLLQRTLRRFHTVVPVQQRMILTTQALKSLVVEQTGDVEVLAEPQGRNTAPCIYWAAREISKRNPKAVMLVMPSDHFIAREELFRSAVLNAVEWTRRHDDLMTLGVKPTRPETGYGYLKIGGMISDDSRRSTSGVFRVESFIEKPGFEKAGEYLRSGQYLWNGGMFVWRADVILGAFDHWMPEMKRAWESSQGDVERAYPMMTATSVDFGIMERAENVVSMPLEAGWDDLGSWVSLESLADVLQIRDSGNTVMAGQALSVDAKGNIVDSPGKFVALLGVQDLVIVEQGDAILIAGKNRCQDLRLVVEQVRKLRPDLA